MYAESANHHIKDVVAAAKAASSETKTFLEFEALCEEASTLILEGDKETALAKLKRARFLAQPVLFEEGLEDLVKVIVWLACTRMSERIEVAIEAITSSLPAANPHAPSTVQDSVLRMLWRASQSLERYSVGSRAIAGAEALLYTAMDIAKAAPSMDAKPIIEICAWWDTVPGCVR